MATVESLNILIKAQTKEAEQRFNRFRDTIRKSLIFTAATAATKQLIDHVDQLADSIDKAGKTAARLGLEANSLVAWQRAGERADVSTKTLETSIQRMVRRVSAAAQGTGEAVKALDELGLSPRQLASLDASEQLERTLKALSGVENQGDKVRLAMKIFDTEGVKLLNLVNDGFNSLQSTLRQTEDSMPDLGNLASEIARANDELARLGERFQFTGARAGLWFKQMKAGFGLMAEEFAENTRIIPKSVRDMMKEGGIVQEQNLLFNKLRADWEKEQKRLGEISQKNYEDAIAGPMQRLINEGAKQMFRLGESVARGFEQNLPQISQGLDLLEKRVEGLQPDLDVPAPQDFGAATRGSLEAFQAVQQIRNREEREASKQRRRNNELLTSIDRRLNQMQQQQPGELQVDSFQLSRR